MASAQTRMAPRSKSAQRKKITPHKNMNLLPLIYKPALLLMQAEDAAETTDDITGGFDIEAFLEMVKLNAVSWAISLAIAIVILIVGRMVVGWIARILRKVLGRAKFDEILVDFLVSIATGVMMLFVIIAAISELGFNTSSMVALVGAAGLAVGFAMQDSLSNFASGVMLIIFHPFKAGDFVEAGGVTGVVERINIFTSTMRTGDNREIIVPNGKIFGDVITNYSARDTRRVDMVFGIGYGDDLLKAKRILEDLVKADDRILAEPKPAVAMNDLGDSSVNFKVRPWVKSADYWDVMSDFTEKVKLTFDAEGISIPFPQMDVHLHKEDNDD